jgi:uncharacterized cofD-like protein
MSKTSKKIVCLGGGNAMPNAVLSELKYCDIEISSVSSMSDSGGSAGEERESYGTPVAYGDIRRAAYQLSGAAHDIKEYLNRRLETEEEIERARKDYPIIESIVSKNPEKFKGHVLSNIISTAATLDSDVDGAIKKLGEIYNIDFEKYKILPATGSNVDLVAELKNGEIITGETKIDKYNGELPIKKVFLDRKSEIHPETKKALENAETILIGPGDLYSSIAQILLVDGVSETIKNSSAKKVYICNLMQKKGETANFRVSDFVKEIEKYSGTELDSVIYNTTQPIEERLIEYRKEHPELIGMVGYEKDLPREKFIGEDLIVSSGPIIHDSKKLIKVIKKICKL